MKCNQLIDFLEKRRQEIYKDERSILKKYDELLMKYGVVRGYDGVTYKKKIKRKAKNNKSLINEIVSLYQKAQLQNEKETLLDDLFEAGYDQDKLIQLIIDAFKKSNGEENLWQYGDLLYRVKNYDYMDEYEKIAKETKYASARQIVVALIGESKKEAEIPFLISLLEDEEIEGHVIWALSNYRKSEVYEIMQKYIDHPRKWIRDIALKYVAKYEKTIRL